MKKGFTLIELLIVIAILAILATVVVLVLNPAELLRQARDSQRISDLGSLNSAIALWTTDVSCTAGSAGCWSASALTNCTAGLASFPGGGTCSTVTSTVVTGNGWVPLDFTDITSGSPLGKLPIDPINNADNSTCAGSPSGCAYALEASTTIGQYKLYANLESTKYTSTNNLESNDGGNKSDWYEVGSNLQL